MGGDKEGGLRGITDTQALRVQESREGATRGQSKANVAPQGQEAQMQWKRGGCTLVEGDNEEGDGRRRVVRKASEGSWKHGQGRLKVNGK